MGLYKNNNGVLTPIAGRGRAEYGASTTRKGAVSYTLTAGDAQFITITYSSPMPDTDYAIAVDVTRSDGNYNGTYTVTSKTVNGCAIKLVSTATSSTQTGTINYTAFKLYTDTEYNNIIDAVPSNASASNKLMTASSVAGLINTDRMSPIAASDEDDFYVKFASAIIAKYPVGSSFFTYVDWAATNTYLHIGMVVNNAGVMFISTTYSRANSNYIVLVTSGTVYKQTL